MFKENTMATLQEEFTSKAQKIIEKQVKGIESDDAALASLEYAIKIGREQKAAKEAEMLKAKSFIDNVAKLFS